VKRKHQGNEVLIDMIIGEVKGNLVHLLTSAIDNNARFIAAQSCNMDGVQAAGISGQLRVLPKIHDVDKALYELGEVSPDKPSIASWNKGEQLFFNLYTIPPDGRGSELDYVRRSLSAMEAYIKGVGRGQDLVLLPLLACGIGDLLWEDVKKVFSESGLKIMVVHYGDKLYCPSDQAFVAIGFRWN
jgi:hypothetical protein